MAATTSRTRRLAEARPAAIAPIPARPSATVRRVESGCTEVAATTTRPGSLTSRSHSVRRNGSSVCGRVAGWLDMADLPRQHMPRKPWSGGLRRGEAGLLRPGVRLGRHHHPPPEHADQRAVLLVPAGLHGDHAAVRLGPGLLLVQHGRLAVDGVAVERSEEHTSELQSRGHLVCRLLLEKKKKNQIAVLVWANRRKHNNEVK